MAHSVRGSRICSGELLVERSQLRLHRLDAAALRANRTGDRLDSAADREAGLGSDGSTFAPGSDSTSPVSPVRPATLSVSP